jgi:hypothetical protein
LHIIKNLPKKSKKKEARREIAHFWCQEMGSPYPTWQHSSCYGERVTHHARSHWDERETTETDDKMLSLLLTCRIVYVRPTVCKT